MSSKVLPTAQAVGKLIASLVGRNATAQPTQAFKQVPKGAVVAVCVDEAKKTVAIIVADVAVAAAAGASLAMIPASAAQDAARNGILPQNIADNFREVANVMTSLFTAGSGRVVRLAEFAVGTVPEEAGPVLAGPGGRLDLEIEVQGYGKGVLSLLVV
ncbi:hypothetical protein [Immundisolibacter sp.]|uniref:hypothetical protein n=1 Tax=Immundisolibacter sp. TaxID=1934948 RepID=UPI0035632707